MTYIEPSAAQEMALADEYRAWRIANGLCPECGDDGGLICSRYRDSDEKPTDKWFNSCPECGWQGEPQ